MSTLVGGIKGSTGEAFSFSTERSNFFDGLTLIVEMGDNNGDTTLPDVSPSKTVGLGSILRGDVGPDPCIELSGVAKRKVSEGGSGEVVASWSEEKDALLLRVVGARAADDLRVDGGTTSWPVSLSIVGGRVFFCALTGGELYTIA